MARSTSRWFLFTAFSGMLGACQPAGEVRVQELPPLATPSPETRAGLPEVAGTWRFVAFALAGPQDSVAPEPVPPGAFTIMTQRLDSLAGFYQAGAGRVPLVGEVRRDSVVSLVAFASEGGRYAAGRVVGDTLWIDATSFGVAESWPPGTRAAFSRKPPPPPPPAPAVPAGQVGALPPAPSTAIDTTRADTIRRDSVRRAPLPQRLPQPAPRRVARPAPPRPAPESVNPTPQPPAPDPPSPVPPDTVPIR